MNKSYEEFRALAYSALRTVAKESSEFADAQMIVGSAETSASLKRHTIHKSIDNEWIDRIEQALPSLDLVIRNPMVAIEDVEEILPVELTKRITEKTVRHLAQHTNLILSVKGDEVIPSKLLNVFREETLLTYENRFVNTLLVRLAAFVDKRYKALLGGSGTEENFKFDYETEFEHFLFDDSGRNTARINLSIELTSPLNEGISELDFDINAKYADALARIKKISMAILGFMSSPFVQKLGRNFIRPPVIRTNAILKNKNLKECLSLWEYIEGCDKVGYSFVGDEILEMPSESFVSDLYSSVALQYTQFYKGVIESSADNKIIAKNNLLETFPDFTPDITEEELEDYLVYDSEYKKTVPVSRLMNNRKKLSEDEKRIREAIVIALKADDILNEEILRREEEERRLERERRIAEEEERRRREEEERQRLEAEAEAAAIAEKFPVEIRYKRSFMSRFIQSDETIQDYYTKIKNTLLSYEGVKARTSFKCETYKHKKDIISKINVMGKALYVYLDLEAKDYEDKNCISIVDKAAFADTPVLVKVKSDRSFNQAMRLIDIMMREKGIAQGELPTEDYRLPYEDDDALIDKGLIKVLLPNGTILGEGDETVKANLSELLADIKKQLEEKKSAEQPEEEIKPEEVTEEAAEEISEAVIEASPEISEDITETAEPIESMELSLTDDESCPVEIRYKRSFMSRYIQADETLQKYYTEIKNEILSYKGVKARTSFKCETYKKKKDILAKINVMGKALYLYLALEPNEYEDKNCITIVNKAAFADTPVLVKVKSDRSFNQAMRLIDIMMIERGLVKVGSANIDYRMPYEDDDALISKGLIKVLLPGGKVLGEGDETVKADLSVILANIRRIAERQEERKQDHEEIKPAEDELDAELRAEILSDDFEEEAEQRESEEQLEDIEAVLESELAEDSENAADAEQEPEEAILPEPEELPEAETVEEISIGSQALISTSGSENELAEAVAIGFAPSMLEVRYKRSFMSRYIQSGEAIQDYYTEIKNLLMSYAGLKARTSFKCETYKYKKDVLAKINVMGKALYLYLALEPEEYVDKNCVYSVDKAAFLDTPVLVKIKSERSLGKAKKLIDDLMSKHAIPVKTLENVNYHLPYEDDDALIEKGLIKILLPEGAKLSDGDETVKANISEVFDSLKKN